MSRSGRACSLLTDWRRHPQGCKEEHGFADGYDGPCTDDPWDIVNMLDDIDPMLRQDETERVRRVLQLVAPEAAARLKEWEDAPVYSRPDDPLDMFRIASAKKVLLPKHLWDTLTEEEREHRVTYERRSMVMDAHRQGAVLTTFSEPRAERFGADDAPPGAGFVPWRETFMVIEGRGYVVPSVSEECPSPVG